MNDYNDYEELRELKLIAFAVATTNLTLWDDAAGQPRCPCCGGGWDDDADLTVGVDGVAHTATCVISRARRLVALQQRQHRQEA